MNNEYNEEVWEDIGINGLKIAQNTGLYRFTSDSVLLSKFVKAKRGEKVADFCAGSGIVGLHFYALNPTVQSVTFFELQEELSALSQKTIDYNGLTNFTAVCCPIQQIAQEYRESFSLILVNPPYETGGFENQDYKKAICRKEITVNLAEIADAAYRNLKYGGRLAMVHRADRLAEIFTVLSNRGIEPKRMQLVSGKANDKPYLVLVEGTKGGKHGLEVLPTLVNK